MRSYFWIASFSSFWIASYTKKQQINFWSFQFQLANDFFFSRRRFLKDWTVKYKEEGGHITYSIRKPHFTSFDGTLLGFTLAYGPYLPCLSEYFASFVFEVLANFFFFSSMNIYGSVYIWQRICLAYIIWQSFLQSKSSATLSLFW
jgi:hypothetical protein